MIIKSPLRWAGGKNSLLLELLNRVPVKYNRYFEPFCGGATLFFALNPEEAYLSDVNEELINFYVVLRDNVNELIEDLKTHKNDIKYYGKLQKIDRTKEYESWDKVKKASRFFYLNSTCWNGLYRINSKGFFNVPFGNRKNPNIVNGSKLKECSEILQGTELRCDDFKQMRDKIQKDDFFYGDPPYVPIKDTSFVSYTKDGFNEEDQRDLKELCDYVDSVGAYFMVSNSHVDFILDLYKDYKIDTVYAPRSINSKGDGRGNVREALITNYENEWSKDWWDI
jgi:DNA adenine methylase